MTQPTSFRLPAELLARLEEEARSSGSSVTTLVSTLLDEGLKIRRFPGIIYRAGPAGRRPGLVGGPDVWELVRAMQHASGQGEERLRKVAEELDIPISRVRLAVDFYVVFPDEIDERIAADTHAASELRERISRRDRLMSG